MDDSLPPGHQLAQAVHAAFQLSVRWPTRVSDWYHDSNYLVVLASPDPLSWVERLALPCTVVTEPDFPGEPVTAVAFLPHTDVGRALSSLPLALKDRAMV